MVGNENEFNKTQDYSFKSFQDEVRKLSAINENLTMFAYIWIRHEKGLIGSRESAFKIAE
jgi:hypothetical protein